VIFVDLALAQTAALGITVAFLAGHAIQSEAAYWYALASTLSGAGLFAVSRTRRGPVPQEAIIGIVYAVSAAAAVLVVDRTAQGGEHIKQLLVGSIVTVTPAEVGTLAVLYGAVGARHWLVRRPLGEISFDPEAAAGRRAVRWWDFVFYASFGLVVTSSVRVAGVLLVFAYLVVPATAAALLTGSVRGRLLVGWTVGVGVSAGGLVASYAWDLPTGAAVVVTFGVSLAAVARLRTMQQEVLWGTREMDEETRARLRQFLAGRSEIAAGDRMVLHTLRGKARERQRYWLGLPLLLTGAAGVLVLLRVRRAYF